jgi:hypothetical protein
MPAETALRTRDPRVTLLREKFYSMRPEPLEQWFYRSAVPPSAERVYWHHWKLGARDESFVSQVPIREVARELCLDPGTVTRAYQVLVRLGLLVRVEPARDPRDPYRQPIAVTEVRVPRELVCELDRHPTRRARTVVAAGPARPVTPATPVSAVPAAASPADVELFRRAHGALSAAEQGRYVQAYRHRLTAFEFDANTRLAPEERAALLTCLASNARAMPTARPQDAATRDRERGPRRLTALDAIRIRRGLAAAADLAGPPPQDTLREIAFAVEEGALTRWPVPHAINIALKKLREAAWTRPKGMPAGWGLQRPVLQTCEVAGH